MTTGPLTPEQHRARREDLLWTAWTGESLVGAAKRIGVSVGALEKWAREQGFPRREVEAMRMRNPGADRFVAERGRAGAAARWAS